MRLKRKIVGGIVCSILMTAFMAITVMAGDAISSVTINGLEYPVKGKTLDTSYTLPSSAVNYTKDTSVNANVEWYDQGTQMGSTSNQGTLIADVENFTVVAGNYYMAKLFLCDVKYLDNTVESYSYFADSVSVTYEVQSRLKNSSVLVANNDSQATVYLFFKADSVYNGANSPYVNCDKVSEYVEVAEDTYAFVIPAGTQPWGKEEFSGYESADYAISVDWYKGTGNSKVAMTEETFVAGQTYTLRVTLNSDYSDKNAYFEDDGFIWFFINNTPGETYQVHPTYMISDFVCVARSTVDNLSVEDIKLPKAYDQMQTTGFSVSKGAKITDVQWYQTSGVEFALDVDGKFRPDTDYSLAITLEPEDGYTFNFEQENVWANAGTVSSISKGVSSTVIYIDFKVGSHTCDVADEWKTDATNHWKECVCGEKKELAAHSYDEGKVTKEASYTAAGEKVYTCTVCGATKTESIAKKVVPAKNKTIKDAYTGNKYKVTKSGLKGGTVEFKAPKSKKVVKITIPSTVRIDGITYKVTSIAKNAFKGCSRLTNVTIGKNVSKIGEKAFYGCKKLKIITIKTTKLKSSTVGKNAFKGTVKKAKVRVPKKSLKAYKKFLYKKGLNKKSRITS